MESDKIDAVNEKHGAGSSNSDNTPPYAYSATGGRGGGGADDLFIDRTISVRDWTARTFHDIPGQLKDYVVGLFPIATWIYRYNLTWLLGDVCRPSSSSSSSSNMYGMFGALGLTPKTR